MTHVVSARRHLHRHVHQLPSLGERTTARRPEPPAPERGLDSREPGWGLTCSECHNANLAVTAIVTTNWPLKKCDACHTEREPCRATRSTRTSTPAAPGTVALGRLRRRRVPHESRSALPAPFQPAECVERLHDVRLSRHEPLQASSRRPPPAAPVAPATTAGTIHPQDATKHSTVASSECVNCHGSADLKTVHGGAGSCAICHGNANYAESLPTGKKECVELPHDRHSGHSRLHARLTRITTTRPRTPRRRSPRLLRAPELTVPRPAARSARLCHSHTLKARARVHVTNASAR